MPQPAPKNRPLVVCGILAQDDIGFGLAEG
jgi:hypothetical protein